MKTANQRLDMKTIRHTKLSLLNEMPSGGGWKAREEM